MGLKQLHMEIVYTMLFLRPYLVVKVIFACKIKNFPIYYIKLWKNTQIFLFGCWLNKTLVLNYKLSVAKSTDFIHCILSILLILYKWLNSPVASLYSIYTIKANNIFIMWTGPSCENDKI